MSRVRASDDLRHWPQPGQRMRDSLFWQVTLPDERLALQVYLFVTGTGRAGYNVAVWGPEAAPLALEQGGGMVGDSDFDDVTVGAVRIRHGDALRTAQVDVHADAVTLDLHFEALHDAFSFRDCPDGLPSWFAEDRIEQTGRVRGTLRVGERTVALAPLGHRDHSWGVRDWKAPQHWKWFVAYTPSGKAVNGWIWIAHGDWGFAGYVLRTGTPVPVATIEQRTTYGDGLQQRRLCATLIDVEGGRTRLELDVFGLLRLPDERTGTEVREGACTALIDGEPGAGQFETEWPLDYLRGAPPRQTPPSRHPARHTPPRG